MKANIVCVCLINGLLVSAFPANDGVYNGIHVTVPVAGVAEFSGTAPATGSVALATHTPCPEVMLPFTPSTPDNGPLPKNIIIGANLADAILSEAGDAKMPEIDAFVEKEFGRMGPQMENGATSDKESALDSTLQRMESEISIELSQFDKFIESELANTEEMVQAALRKVESETECTDHKITQTVTKELTEQEAIVQLALLILQSFVESKLAETDNLVKYELEKVNTFMDTELEKTDALIRSKLSEMESVVESNLARTESLVESESEKVDRFIEAELAKTEAFVNSELSKIEKELEKVEKALEVDDSCTMSSDDTPMLPYIDTGSAPPTIGTRNPSITLNEAPYNHQYLGRTAPVLYHRRQLPVVNVIRGTARATGNIKLFSKFPCPPLQATEIGPDGKKYIWIKKTSGDKGTACFLKYPGDREKPSQPKLEIPQSSDPKGAIETNCGDPGSEEPEDLGPPIPIRGEVVFEGTAPAYGSVSITGHSVEP
ncbi:uncharacterized protein LOC134676803 [Cydia fagiglandana]|uniref:uncharacterized protein LOC134676803 n=1 Tax=Cydia fagiglandana TaxID=1458189 RepID=UPI002FEE3C4E